MPMYVFKCANCGKAEDRVTKIADRDSQVCECGAALDREEISTPGLVSVDHGFQMKAVMKDGSHVEGHFGREAPRRKIWT